MPFPATGPGLTTRHAAQLSVSTPLPQPSSPPPLQVKECTFRPRIDARSRALMSERDGLLRAYQITAHEQLFQDAIRRQAKAEELAEWVPEGVTFHPAVNTDDFAKEWTRRSLDTFARSSGSSAGRALSVVDRLYAAHEKAKAKLEAARLAQGIDPATGRPLHHPQVRLARCCSEPWAGLAGIDVLTKHGIGGHYR
eukprot:364197-Chlamydomonas_euryale.AAC.57